ncbi:sensor histidine kinase [Paenibacillus nanensis]|uniref:Heme sensor protein HssS n=1 Tax=Paenibacillus nanensis TaxID=393251 RepID=A0A3A1UR74_9BACL|nr:ATP-binding protein [Paenibacillus nanensis]RIX51047.1 sensor histidine kinase [Paenibacillus nanensis]
MIRSLYVRITATFLIVVVASIALSFLLNSLLFKQQSRGSLMEELDNEFGRIQQLHDVSAPVSLEPFLQELSAIHKLSIVAVGPDEEVIAVGKRGSALRDRVLHSRELDTVLDGGAARTMVPDGERSNGYPPPPAFGRLVELNGEKWALFLLPERYPQTSNFIATAVTLLLSLLVIGSILIVIAARYLVKPIKQMNDAAVTMAEGNFSIRLPDSRGDELGQLAKSMNTMARSLSQLETMRQDFVANVSHELQSPLTSIHGYAEALRSRDVTDAERERYVGIIQQESGRLSKLSENLLKLSSLDSQHHPFHPAPIRLDKQLRQLVLAFEPAWRNKGLHIELDVEPLGVHGDEDLLSGVWSNLLTNSIKFTPAGGTIAISLTQQEDSAVVEFADSGIGVAEEDRERIFERFYKADTSRNRNAGGSGLGLSIARKIVDLHGGTIRLESTPPGRSGARFVVMLPLGQGR